MLKSKRIEVWTLILLCVGMLLCFLIPEIFHVLTMPKEGTSNWSSWKLFWWSGGTTQPLEWWFGLGDRLSYIILSVAVFYLIGCLIRKRRTQNQDVDSQSK
ncbi:MAG: hypothetical protein ABIH42_10225 [Planctomycetota bacterium]